MELRKLKTLVLALGAGTLLTIGAPASAALINDGLTSGVLNTIEDQDREAFIDVDGSGTLSIGDVFIGFVRMDNFLPSGDDVNNQVYGVISNQITAVGATPNEIYLGTTTVVGLRLEDLTGDANTAGGMFAIYDGTYANNLITDPLAPDLEANLDEVASETLRLVVGLQEPDDFLFVLNNVAFGIGSSTDAFTTLSTSISVGSFSGGLTFLYNNTVFEYDETVSALNPTLGLTTHQVVIGNGAIRGAVGDGNEAIFGNAGSYGFTQCLVDGVSTACGFVTDADFFVAPNRVPEPATLALLGVALVGLGGFTRKARAA